MSTIRTTKSESIVGTYVECANFGRVNEAIRRSACLELRASRRERVLLAVASLPALCREGESWLTLRLKKAESASASDFAGKSVSRAGMTISLRRCASVQTHRRASMFCCRRIAKIRNKHPPQIGCIMPGELCTRQRHLANKRTDIVAPSRGRHHR